MCIAYHIENFYFVIYFVSDPNLSRLTLIEYDHDKVQFTLCWLMYLSYIYIFHI